MKGDDMNDILVFHYKSSEVRTVELNGEAKE